MCCISTGRQWQGHAVRQGPVVYVAGEGQGGLSRRFRAWEIGNRADLSKAPLFVALQPVQLTDSGSVASMIVAVEKIVTQAGPPALIVIDTLSRNLGCADENSPADMNLAIGAADRFRALWRCSVMFLHHSGHQDKSRGRGHSALRGALDSEFRMEKGEDGIVRLEASKIKDGESPEPMAFRVHAVDLGFKDDEGEPVTSAVLDRVEWEEKPDAAGSKAGRGKWQSVGMEALRSETEIHRRNLEADKRDPAEARVSIDAWRAACLRAGMPRQRFYDVKASLLELNFITEDFGNVAVR